MVNTIAKEIGYGNISNVKFSNIKIYHELGRAININISQNISSTSISDITFSNIKYNSKKKNLFNIGNETNQITNVKFEKVLTKNKTISYNDKNYNE